MSGWKKKATTSNRTTSPREPPSHDPGSDATAPTILHLQSSMAIRKVLDTGGEASGVSRVFVADHAALANGGGANPTYTGQALAIRTENTL